MKLCRSLTVFSAGLLVSTGARAADFTVTTQANAGPGSLRGAIILAAVTPGKDTIKFDIATALPEITLLAPLEALNGDTIDGFNQSGGTRVKLRWNFQGSLLPVEGDGAVIQGLEFQSDFPSSGPPPAPGSVSALRLGGAGSHLVKACWFSGFQAAIVATSPNNIIGGSTGMRNRFAVYIAAQIAGTAASPATGTVIRGNEFLPPANTAPLTTGYHRTITAEAFSDNTTIESDATTGAVNTFDGLFNILYADGSANLVFRGNRAGDTTPNATVAGSSNNGLVFLLNCPGSIVENNSMLQSGNMVFILAGCPNARVRGNTIINSGSVSVPVFNANTAIGVSGNGNLNVHISGNVIGGMQDGIRIRNIEVTALTGIRVDGNFVGLSQAYTPASESPVVVDPAVLLPCDGGIVVEGNTTDIEIGGNADAGSGRLGPNTVIATRGGIVLMRSFASSYLPQRIRADRNRVALISSVAREPNGPPVAEQWIVLDSHYTGNLVALWSYSIPANDPLDPDTGSNGLMNYPTLTVSATDAAGTLNTKPNTACTIQVNACATDGKRLTGIPVFIGSASVVTDSSGHASYSIPLTSPPPAGSIYYAMATDDQGNTSHIGSKVATPVPAVSLTLPAPEVKAVEGTPFPITVTRSGNDLSIASTVSVLITPGDAAPPAANGDGTDAGNSAPVTFLPGEATKSVLIPITDDDFTEPAEKVRLTLQATSGAEPGAVTTGLITIAPSDLPRVSIGNATVVEGNSDRRVVTLPVSIDRPVQPGFPPVSPRLRFRFAGGTATRDVDYSRADAWPDDFLHVQFPPGGTEDVVHMVLHGDSGYEPDETVIVEYDHTIETFPDGSPLIDDSHHPQGTLTIQDDDQAVVRIVPLDVAVPEGDSGTTPANLSIQLVEGPIDIEVRVPWQTVNGTALAGSDFVAASGEVVLAPGTTSQTIAVQVTGDTVVDSWPAADESFTVQLGKPVNAIAAAGQSSTTVSIQDDDARAITLIDASLTEGHSGTAVMTFTATIPSPTGSPVSFEWNAAAETADSSDYTGLNGTLTIPAGQTEAFFDIQVKGDTLYEINETFSIVAGLITNGTLTRERATGTILNDDTAPSLSLTNTVVTEGPEDVDFYAWFQVRLSAASGAPVTFQWSTVAGTATAGLDYTDSSNTAVIPPGDRNHWIAVPVLGDNLSESDETFQLHIPGASGATVPPAGLTGTCTLKEMALTVFPLSDVPGLYILSFWTGLGQSYVIEKSTSLGDDQEWSIVSGIITGSNAEIDQTQYSVLPSAYFRVRATATPPN